MERGYLLSGSDGQGSLMGRNGESAFGLAAARGGVELGVGARFARFGTGAGTSNVASEPLREDGVAAREIKEEGVTIKRTCPEEGGMCRTGGDVIPRA